RVHWGGLLYQELLWPAVGAFAAGAALTTMGNGPAAAEARSWERLNRIDAGTQVVVRTTNSIDINNADGRVYNGIVDEDVVGSNGQLLIPRGATVELLARPAPNNEVRLDLDSILINGQRYAVNATGNSLGTAGQVDRNNRTLGANQETLEHVGGGALLGTIIGAIAGGGKGAAVGAP